MTQSHALDILKLGHNIFLTGAAGSGKTYVLNQYIRYLKQHGVGVAVTASTGIAATHLGGTTIHSWSGIGVREKLSKSDLHDLRGKSYLRKHFANTHVLVIDEASMLHAKTLDLVNQVCKAFKENEQPFGGMQVILSGDLFQLPPITRNSENVKYFTESAVWSEMRPHVSYLTEQHRHDDDHLSDVLNAIRANAVQHETLDPLRKRYKATIEGVVQPTKLYTHNIDVDRINDQELSKIPGDPAVYEMWTKGRRPLVATLMKSCLTPEVLRVKEGAIVMFVKNNFELGYANGTLGVVVGFDDDTNYPLVKTYSGKKILASPEQWSIEEEGKVKAQLTQIPLRLAWAITVHKSQGMTLDAAEINLSKSFVPGMGYVALSRIRSLSGLRLMGLNDTALTVDERVAEIDVTLHSESKTAVQYIDSLDQTAKRQRQRSFIEQYTSKEVREEKVPTINVTKMLIEQSKSLEEVADERGLAVGTIVNHLEKLKARGDQLAIDHLKPQAHKLDAIVKAFAACDDARLSPVKEILGDEYSYDELRLARLFLED